MNVDIQVKLLRVIQERTFHRIGGRDEIKSNVRIITSTNRNLEEEVSEKRFRKDLYYRINVIKITVPPLRERPEDISLLSYYFLKKYANEFAKPVTSIAPTIMDRFLRYRWEGNVRELENTIERAVAVTNSSEISVRDLPPDFSEPNLPLPGEPELKPFQLAKQEFEIQYLKHILNRALGNMALASRLSDIPRQNLYNKLKKYGIERESFR
jgi:two-component system response regulator HydG